MNEDIIKRAISLEKKIEATDSKIEEDSLKEELKSLGPELEKLNGSLVELSDGTIGRIWHSFLAKFSFRGSRREWFNWSSNTRYVDLEGLKFLEEDHEKLLEELEEIDLELYKLQKEKEKLTQKRRDLTKDVVPMVNPNDFQETSEVQSGVFSLGSGANERTYVQEAFCEITGDRITS